MRPRHLSLAGLALLAAVSPAVAQQLRFTPFHASGIYDLGERAGWTLALPPDAAAAKYTYTIRKNNLDTITTGALDFSQGTATIELTLGEPAMLYVDVRPAEGADSTAIHLGAAIAPTQLKPAVPRPADFDSFWDGKLKALAEAPVNPMLTPAQTSKAGVELYTVQLDSLGSRRCVCAPAS